MRISDWSSDVCSSDLTRRQDSVEVDGLPVRVKISPGRIKVEHDDAAHVARSTGRPLREVLSRAEEAGRQGLRVVDGDVPDTRSEERRVGKEWVSTCRSGGSA